MPWYRIGGLVMHLHLDKRQRKKWPPACPFFRFEERVIPDTIVTERVRVRCLVPANYLCDWLGCNVPICDDHRQQLVPGFDFCPHHNARRGLLSRLLPPPEDQRSSQ